MEVFKASLSGIPLLRIVGDVDHFSAPALEAVAQEAIAPDSGRLLFDLSAVRYIDSGGAGLFLTLDRDLRANGLGGGHRGRSQPSSDLRDRGSHESAVFPGVFGSR